MFEQELFNEITDNFEVEGFDITVGFGEVPESTKAPYIVMYPINEDGTRQVICNPDNYTDGVSTIQFSIYDVDYSNAYYIARQLDIMLADLTDTDNYNILLDSTNTNRGFPDLNTGLSLHTLTRTFTYTAKSEIYYKRMKLKSNEGNLIVNIAD